MTVNHSPYLSDALNDTAGVVERACSRLERIDFDAIVVTGVSGMMIGPIVAHSMGKRLAVVRKPHEIQNYEISYAEILVETNMKAADTWIFFDDLIASGATIQRVTEVMDVAGRSEVIGYYLYNGNVFVPGRWD